MGDQHQRGASLRRAAANSRSITASPVAWSRLPVGSSASSSSGCGDEGAGQRDALLLAAGKLAGQVGQPVSQADRAQRLRARGPWRRRGRPAPAAPRRSPARSWSGSGGRPGTRCRHASRRSRASASSSSAVTSWPASTTLPEVARSSPASTISRLVLPEPDGPTRPTASPAADVEVDAAQDVDRPGGGGHGQVEVSDLHERRGGFGGNRGRRRWHPWRQHMASAPRWRRSRGSCSHAGDRAGCWPLACESAAVGRGAALLRLSGDSANSLRPPATSLRGTADGFEAQLQQALRRPRPRCQRSSTARCPATPRPAGWRGWTGCWPTARMRRSSSWAPMTGCAAWIRAPWRPT